jgi:hypothetical protein
MCCLSLVLSHFFVVPLSLVTPCSGGRKADWRCKRPHRMRIVTCTHRIFKVTAIHDTSCADHLFDREDMSASGLCHQTVTRFVVISLPAALPGGVVQLTNGTWMLEHCHGVIPALLPFGLGDAIFSSMDLVTIYRSLTAYGRLVIKELIENGKI